MITHNLQATLACYLDSERYCTAFQILLTYTLVPCTAEMCLPPFSFVSLLDSIKL